jgi:hypothetical protein
MQICVADAGRRSAACGCAQMQGGGPQKPAEGNRRLHLRLAARNYAQMRGGAGQPGRPEFRSGEDLFTGSFANPASAVTALHLRLATLHPRPPLPLRAALHLRRSRGDDSQMQAARRRLRRSCRRRRPREHGQLDILMILMICA